jgi:hypothetical protein
MWVIDNHEIVIFIELRDVLIAKGKQRSGIPLNRDIATLLQQII